MTSNIPTADVAPKKRALGSLLLPTIALLVAAWLGFANWAGSGPTIEVHADEGHGIEPGDPLRYRGIHVGSVDSVSLEPDLSGVRIELTLEPDAAELAREGSRFWIVRPHVGLDSVQGLETIVGARYLSVLPGPAGAAPSTSFRALVEPPLAERLEADGLQLVLEAPSRFHLQAGAPIAYRQIQVGVVTSVELASDANAVEVSVYIRPDYKHLVRRNTRFWETGGIEIDLQLMEGLSVEMESLRSLLIGGVAIATPESAGSVAENGDRFTLHDDAKPEWLEWRPGLPIGPNSSRTFEHPPLFFADLEWKDDGVLRRSRSRRGWITPIADGLVVGPADLLSPVDSARDPGATLSACEGSAVLATAPTHAHGELAERPWPTGAERVWTRPQESLGEPRDTVVLGGDAQSMLGLDAARVSRDGDAWRIVSGPQLDSDWHGALVLERDSRKWIGVVLVDDDGVRVVSARRGSETQ